MNETPQARHIPEVVVGWLLAAPLDEADRVAVEQAHDQVLDVVGDTFPAFKWRMPIVRQLELVQQMRVDPVTLIDAGVIERDLGNWDFAFVVTQADLRSIIKAVALGTPSQFLGVAVLSTARLDPIVVQGPMPDEERVALLARRVRALALHLLGHLAEVPHSDDPASFMFNLQDATDLERMTHYTEEDQAVMREELADVADVRLEELGVFHNRAIVFYLQALWHNRSDIMSAVLQIRPWKFPFYFSGLTTAAFSTLVILIITAEAWDLGMSQSPLAVLLMSLVALAGTSIFILKRQRLLVTHRSQRLTEQRVISRVSITVAVVLGMVTTYLMLFLGTVLLSQTLFSLTLIREWATSVEGAIQPHHFVMMAGFVAALGIIVGALGASFESQSYVRHIAYVDEET